MTRRDEWLTQMTLIQIDDYGQWTNTLGGDRENKLQVLQADLFSFLQKSFAERDGLVFYNRFDEMLAVTNGIGRKEHEEIGKGVSSQFPFTVSMGVGVGKTPFEAQLKASRLLQQRGSAQSKERKAVVACEGTIDLSRSYAQVLHFDVDGVTGLLTDRVSAYETSVGVMSLYVDLMKLLKVRGVLLFFVGGDNFMGLASGATTTAEVRSLLRGLDTRDDGMRLKCGMGVARTGRKAAELATTNLDLIRQTDRSMTVLSTVKLQIQQ